MTAELYKRFPGSSISTTNEGESIYYYVDGCLAVGIVAGWIIWYI